MQNCDPQLQTPVTQEITIQTLRCASVHVFTECCDPLFHVTTVAYNSPDNITTKKKKRKRKTATDAAYYGQA
jgi:hypothetical protein